MTKEIIDNMPIDDIKPCERNPRKNDQAVNAVVKSIEKLGYRTPIIIDENNTILCGHTRYKAIKKMAWDHIPFVVKFTDLTEKQKDEYRIIDNKTGEIAEWDFEILTQDFTTEELLDFGFDIKDLPQEDVVEDEAPPVPEIPRTIKGDIYQLGNHRIMCGDSTVITDFEKLMDGKKADMVFTSPPYNGNTTMYDYIIVNGEKKRKDRTLYRDNNTDNKTSDDYIKFLNDILTMLFLFTNGYIFWNINYNAKSRYEYLESVYPFRHNLRETIIWKKQAIPTANGFTRNSEFIFMFATSDDIKHLNAEYAVTHTVWEVNNAKSQQKEHKACFPIALPTKAIQLSDKTNLVLDPFLGSGSTLIACEQTNRICYGMELDEKYCDVIVQRWVNLTGGKVILNGNEIEWVKNNG